MLGRFRKKLPTEFPLTTNADHGYVQYPSLDQSTRSIRLLRFDLTAPSDQICCTLETYKLDQCPPFVALSYTWGSPTPKFEMSLASVVAGTPTAPRPFHVRENLWAALHQLKKLASAKLKSRVKLAGNGARPPGYSVQLGNYFWIDAICINQADLGERAHQVNMMKDIFTTADFVTAWLGSEDRHTRRAFRYLAQGRSLSDLVASPAEFYAIISLLKRDYWTRMWVMQEFTLPSELLLLCGSQRVWWSEIFEQVSSICRSPKDIWAPKRPGIELIRGRYEREMMRRQGIRDVGTLDDLILAFGGGACSDPRDTVFALLPMVQRWPDHDILGRSVTPLVADYTTTAIQLFYRVIQCTQGFAEGSDRLGFLGILAKNLQINHQEQNEECLAFRIMWFVLEYGRPYVTGELMLPKGVSLSRVSLPALRIVFGGYLDQDQDDQALVRDLLGRFRTLPKEDPELWHYYLGQLHELLADGLPDLPWHQYAAGLDDASSHE
ncbi:heterokaryon incompatibility protein-domain-containing protein [Xylariaceae sp. FL0804]|nr:heterokaryon incompatibility protein-domain-containing protein [Xylariaceae sp. FL0804]